MTAPTRELTPRPADMPPPPIVSIAEARSTIEGTAQVARDAGYIVPIQGQDYWRVEGWLMLAAQCGCAPKTLEVREIRDGGKFIGYEADVAVIRIATGEEIGRATGSCFNDELMRGKPRWTERHAMLAMAQTRATSRALGQVLRWVVALSGAAGTPAEEMPPEDPQPAKRQKKAAPKEPREAQRAGDTITSEQRTRLWTIARETGRPDAEVEAVVRHVCQRNQYESTSDIQAAHYDAVLEAIKLELKGLADDDLPF